MHKYVVLKSNRGEKIKWKYKQGRWRWQSRRTLSSSPPVNTSKIWPHVEQLSWKQPGDWQKDSSTTKAIRKDPHRVWWEAWRSNLVRTHTPNRGHRKRKKYNGLRYPPWGVRSSSHILGTPALESSPWKMSPLSWFENQWSVRSRDCSCRARAHTHLLPVTVQRQQIENCLRLWPTSQDQTGAYLTPHQVPAPAPLALVLLSTRADAAIAKENAHTRSEWNQLRPNPASDKGRGSLCQLTRLCPHLGGAKLAPGRRLTLPAGASHRHLQPWLRL